jgi:hypothetical protein
MIIINYNSSESDGKTIEQLLDMHDIDISREIINVICEAIDKEIDMVCAVEIRTPTMVYSFTSTTSSYIQTLKKNIEIMIVIEDYELCAKAMKYIKKMEYRINSRKLLVDSKK